MLMVSCQLSLFHLYGIQTMVFSGKKPYHVLNNLKFKTRGMKVDGYPDNLRMKNILVLLYETVNEWTVHAGFLVRFRNLLAFLFIFIFSCY